MDLLEEALDALFTGRGGLVLLGGEAGIGKSRLAMEVAERAARRGAATLRGAAYEQEKQLPYGPFVEALEGFAGPMRPDDLRALSGDAVPELVRLVPPSPPSSARTGWQPRRRTASASLPRWPAFSDAWRHAHL